eukprot:jgi/Botrbrau1/14254/Bobra.113_2s0002.1
MWQVIPIAVERVHTALGPTWDWSGAAAAPLPTLLKDRSSNGPASSSEEAREKSDVQRAYYSFLHALATASLSPCLFQVLGARASDTVLPELIRGGACHVDPTTRKVCVQTLRRLLADMAREGPQPAGLETFLLDCVVNQVCISGLLKSSLDYRDGAVNALLGELAALLIDANLQSSNNLGHYLRSTLQNLGVAPGPADLLIQHVISRSPKDVKMDLREMLQVSSGRGARGRGNRPNGVTPDRSDCEVSGM